MGCCNGSKNLGFLLHHWQGDVCGVLGAEVDGVVGNGGVFEAIDWVEGVWVDVVFDAVAAGDLHAYFVAFIDDVGGAPEVHV